MAGSPLRAAVRPRPLLALLTSLCTFVSPAAARPAEVPESSTHVHASRWYDWGWYGTYPSTSYESFGADSPLYNIVADDERCDDGLIFIEPRGSYVETPGPVVTDRKGNLVWTHTRWGQAMDLKVQSYKGKEYITFWIGEDVGTFAGGTGSYLMLDEHYEIFKEVVPAGGHTGDLHEFRITDEGTALMTIYQSVDADIKGDKPWKGWIYDCLFQEIDIETGELIFEWRATDHYQVLDSLQPPGRTGGSADNGFDFFHINSIDKNADGDYLISGRHMCSVSCVSHVDGSVLWQLGGRANGFTDLSDGKATNFAWNHHASWYGNSTTVTVFDNESNGQIVSGSRSRGLMISLDLEKMTASLVHEYIAPLNLLAPSQGSVQALPNGNVLVGWGHTPAYTEYSLDGEVLCDVHFGPVWFANFGWVKSYRTFKFPWVGRPNTAPDVAVRPRRNAVFASWNGATEVSEWALQSSSDAGSGDAGAFADHGRMPKTSFETEMAIPDDAGDYLRVVALDCNGDAIGTSKVVSRHAKTATPLLEAPSRHWMPQPLTIFFWSLCGFLLLLAGVFRFRGILRRSLMQAVGRGMSSHKYEPVPMR